MEYHGFPLEVTDFHKQLIVVDGHCDTILEMFKTNRSLKNHSVDGHVDLQRLIEGGVRVQFFAAFIESIYKPFNCLTRVMQLIDYFYHQIEACDDLIRVGLSKTKIKKYIRDGKLVAILGIEGGEALNGDLSVLRNLYRLGVRLLGLTWNQRNQLADGADENNTGGGLTKFGVQVVKEMNRLGMMIDLSHISERGFWDVLEKSSDPVIVSHANCYKLCNHQRNLKDEQIKALAAKGGMMGMSFVPEFLGAGNTDIDDLVNHIVHVAGLVGTDILALGSDFDGINQTTKGLEDCTCYPSITGKLLERGFTKNEVRAIMGKNMLRFINLVIKS